MEPVPQKVLNWLHRVLQPQYADVNRSYNDAAIALGQWPSLRPSTDVFTFDNGQSALLLRLAGTVPVSFRGVTYSIPVTVWIPAQYPLEAPMVFVTPTQAMAVRPGQHVSGEGKVYHPYLAGWTAARSTISELVRVLQDIFGREPPVVAVQAVPAQNQSKPQQEQISAPPVPPLPPELNRTSSVHDLSSSTQSPLQAPPHPPALPPKPGQETRQSPVSSTHAPPAPYRPSLADQRAQAERQSQSDGPQRQTSTHSTRYSQPPPLPPQQDVQRPPSGFQSWKAQGKQPSYSPVAERHPRWQPQGFQPHQAAATGPSVPQPPPQQHQQGYQQQHQWPPQPPQPLPPGHPQQQYANPPLQPQPRKPSPPRDLLTDPFDPPLPTQSEPLPAPPIPPNPEKDALLSALSHTLTSRLHAALSTNESALAPLHAQHQALLVAFANLQREQQALAGLSSQIGSNSEIFNQAMRDADQCIARAQTASAPGVDEVLVAPTLVGQQLYDLVAEVQALVGARDMLARALDRGRIGPEGWVKSVRALAREEFLKRVLVEKAAAGMGLLGEGRGEGGWI